MSFISSEAVEGEVPEINDIYYVRITYHINFPRKGAPPLVLNMENAADSASQQSLAEYPGRLGQR